MNQPIVVDKNGVIIVGHGRFAALQHLGWEVKDEWIKVVDLNEEQAKTYRLADNKLNESDWDMDLVVEELKDLSEPMIELSGFDKDLVIEPEEADDEVPDVPEEPQSKLGDLYELGEHRVLCGDSMDAENIDKLLNGTNAELVFTDPPYQIQTKGGTRSDIAKSLQKQGEAIEFIADFEPDSFLYSLPFVFKNGVMNAYVFCNKELLPNYLNWAKLNKYSFNVLVWKKPNAIPIGDSHRPDIEYLLLFRKNATWNNGLSHIVNYSRLIESKRETGLHPTMKPVNIITNQLQISSKEAGVVYDAFLGSGSTLIAAEKTKRVCYGMELDPKYVDVIITRWCEYTGTDKIKCNGKEIDWQKGR